MSSNVSEPMNKPGKIAVIGAGSWGTALAQHLCDCGHHVALWARRPELIQEIVQTRQNSSYLPDIRLSDALEVSADYASVLRDAHLVVSAVPAQSVRETWKKARAYVGEETLFLCAAKGIETSTQALMSDVFNDVLPKNKVGYIGGPSFAQEVAKHLPTVIVIASAHDKLARKCQEWFSNDWLRAYVTHDIIGCQLGGALKNVIAIACGVADGMQFGTNARAALITRGLAEVSRLAVRMGAEPLTLAGLAGMGDLVLTCTGDLSRNRRVGIELGKGGTLTHILKTMGHVAEGVETTKAAVQLAKDKNVEMPIINEMHRILYEGRSPQEAVISLMRRSLKHELE